MMSKLSSDKMIHYTKNLEWKHGLKDDGYVYFELVGNASHLFFDTYLCPAKIKSIKKDSSSVYFEAKV